ncbi:MAG: hypothetical protein H7Y32_15830 [Chloroflexales bacterium]|nr:hypothetical protein [Chloroflexales bacterium]
MMRRAALLLLLLLLVALVALGALAWQRFANASYGELVLAGAVDVRVERAGWQLTKISYSVPVIASNPGIEQLARGSVPARPSRAVARAVQGRLYPLGWARMEGAERTGPTLFEFGMTRARYSRTYLFGLASETVLLVGYDGPPADVRLTVTRMLHLPRLPGWLRTLFGDAAPRFLAAG